MLKLRSFLAAAAFLASTAPAFAQPPQPPAAPAAPVQATPAPQAPAAQAPGTLPVCGGMYQIGPPAKLPPAGSGPIIYQVAACFEKQGGFSGVEPQTYLYYMEIAHQVSDPAPDRWIPWTDKMEQTVIADFKRLMATNFLDDLSIESIDYPFSNGVIGKVLLYNMEEGQRVKIVDYVGSKKVEMSKIDEELKKKGIRIALGSFVDPGTIKQVAGLVRDLYAEKGYEYADVKPEIKAVSTATKTVNVSFHITEGPRARIRSVDFQGNSALADAALAKQMKENKGPNKWMLFMSKGGTFKEGKFE